MFPEGAVQQLFGCKEEGIVKIVEDLCNGPSYLKHVI